MNANQLDNIIDLFFLFHGLTLDTTSPDYLIEKWDKFVGCDPYDVEYLKLVHLKEDYECLRKHGISRSQVFSVFSKRPPLGMTVKEANEILQRVQWSSLWVRKNMNRLKIY